MNKRRMWMLSMAVVLVLAVAGVGFAAAQGGHPFDFGRGMGMGGPDNTLLTVVSEQLGIEVTDLVTELQGGKTVAQLAEENGVALDTIVAAIITQHSELMAAQVEAGRLTQAQADAMLALHTANITAQLSNTMPVGRGAAFVGMQNPLITVVAEQLGMEVTDLVTEIQGGKTVAQLAEEKGVALDTIVAAIVAQHSELLAAQVEAGRLTQAQADARLALETANLTAELSGEFGLMYGMDMGRGMDFGGRLGPQGGRSNNFRGPQGGRHGGFGLPLVPDTQAPTATPEAST
ncbi:MAG: hypothetical protein H6671_07010 [Anaerolineaceae bacterium]|nr:hypothetical protein [Anaerolineaceae bacterium]